MTVWPESRLNELATGIILNTKGSAFGKLQLRQKKLITRTREGTEEIMKTVGGQLGQVNLEQKFDLPEKPLFRSKKINLKDVQAHITLLGSRSLESRSKVQIRVLGSNFFQEFTTMKTYDRLAFGVENAEEINDESVMVYEL